jgi:PTH1 family peptidyl-tRNA hydrolase
VVETIQIVAGLGNPGRQYERTPHNAGFMAVEALARRWGCRMRRRLRWRARVGEAVRRGARIVLVQPLTFMNLSGHAVERAVGARGAEAAGVLVIVDDADLPLGDLRLRRRGSTAGHRGLLSVAAALGTEEFPRLRIGIGRGAAGSDLVAHVLGALTPTEWESLQRAVQRAVEAVECLLDEGFDRAMTRFNAREAGSRSRPGSGPGGEP